MEPLRSISVVVDPPADPQLNMDRDLELAARVFRDRAPPTLRVYGWSRPALSLGRRQRPDDLPPDLLRRGLALVYRPTGGGVVLHRTDELTYAFAFPRSLLPAGVALHGVSGLLHAYLRDTLVARGRVPAGELAVVKAAASAAGLFCFSSPVRGDLLYRGRKVAGAALRVWKAGVLVQGSLQGFPASREEILGLLASFDFKNRIC